MTGSCETSPAWSGRRPAGGWCSSSEPDPEDVVQETLLAIHMKRHTWRQDEPVGPWVHAIARYKIVDAFRRRGRVVTVDIEDFSESLAGEEAPVMHERDIERALQCLTDGQRQVVSAISLEGRSIIGNGRKAGHEGECGAGRAASRARRDRDPLRESGRMKTDDLIRAIAADAGKPPVSMRGVWLAGVGQRGPDRRRRLQRLLGPRPDFAAGGGDDPLPVQVRRDGCVVRFGHSRPACSGASGSASSVLGHARRARADHLTAIALELMALPRAMAVFPGRHQRLLLHDPQ
jgi:DNA-directed RNA polymerase specialized sigma24 family protein